MNEPDSLERTKPCPIARDLLLAVFPGGCPLHFFQREGREYEMRVIGEERERFGLVQCQAKKLFLTAKRHLELAQQPHTRFLDFGQELAAIIEAKAGESVFPPRPVNR